MRLASLALLVLFCVTRPHANGQDPAPHSVFTDQGSPPPPVVAPNSNIGRRDPEADRRRVLADLRQLITEARTLQRDLDAAPVGTVSAQSFKRAQRIEGLAKQIRKTLKDQ
jgi:hypothetical protein